MKRSLLVLLLTAAIFGFGGYNLFRLNHAKTAAIEGLDSAVVYLHQKAYQKASEQAEAVFQDWKKQERVLRLFTRRNYVDEAADVLAELPPLAEEKNESEFLGRVEKAKNIIEHIWESELPALDTLLRITAPSP